VNAARSRQREAARPSPAAEDYLKAVYLLRTEDPAAAVTVQRLAERLKVSGPSVTNMAKRLAELGLLRHEPYRGVGLTPAGERVALEVVRHHRLLEQYLVEALGYGWDEVHEEADRLEHHISEAMEARMAAALGNPTADPHGDPIPGVDGSVPRVAEARLPDLPPGGRGVVRRAADQDPERLRYLDRLGIRPGAAITLLEAHPFDGPLRIRGGGAEHVLGRALGATILVAPGGVGDGDHGSTARG
jgi:DtxR family transcriptional regulator, Mn-dependent transcriptional regulator